MHNFIFVKYSSHGINTSVKNYRSQRDLHFIPVRYVFLMNAQQKSHWAWSYSDSYYRHPYRQTDGQGLSIISSLYVYAIIAYWREDIEICN